MPKCTNLRTTSALFPLNFTAEWSSKLINDFIAWNHGNFPIRFPETLESLLPLVEVHRIDYGDQMPGEYQKGRGLQSASIEWITLPSPAYCPRKSKHVDQQSISPHLNQRFDLLNIDKDWRRVAPPHSPGLKLDAPPDSSALSPATVYFLLYVLISFQKLFRSCQSSCVTCIFEYTAK